MANKFEKLYEFKITLLGISPPIWRKILVPDNYTFWDLHVAIQDSMGWTDSHLHEFEVINPSEAGKVIIGIQDDSFDDERTILPGWEQKIAAYFSMNNPEATYLYDFGDDWMHEIRLENVLAREKGLRYPVCVAGERACPPEDCGGIWGYQNFMKIIANPAHKEYEETLEWVGGSFDPERFDLKGVHFDNPKKRWKLAFE